MTKTMLLLATAVASLMSTGASAGLLGDTVDVAYATSFGFFRSDSFLVGPGVELSCLGASSLCAALFDPATLDIQDNAIVFAYNLGEGYLTYGPGSFNGWQFTSLDLGAPIVSVTLSSFGYTGLDASRLSFTANTISLNLANLSADGVNGWRINIETAAVPEPAVLGLLAMGVLGLAARRRRR
jgi:hypothetical protein